MDTATEIEDTTNVIIRRHHTCGSKYISTTGSIVAVTVTNAITTNTSRTYILIGNCSKERIKNKRETSKIKYITINT